jgi:hypothetical protein
MTERMVDLTRKWSSAPERGERALGGVGISFVKEGSHSLDNQRRRAKAESSELGRLRTHV